MNPSRSPNWLVFFVRQLTGNKTALLLTSVLTLAITLASAASPLLIGRMVDESLLRSGDRLLLLGLWLAGTFLAAELLTALRSYVSIRAMQQLTSRLTLDTVAAVFRTTADFFTRTPRGELLQRCIQDTRMIQEFGLLTIPTLVQAALLGGTAIAVISRIHWPVAILIVLTYILLFIPVHIFGRRRGEARRQLIRHNAVLRHSLLEKLEAHKQIRLFGTARQEYEQFAREQETWARLSFQEQILTDAFKGFPRLPDALAPSLAFLFVGWQVVNGQATIGELMTVIAFIPAINAPVRLFFMQYVALADIRLRLQGLLDYVSLSLEPGARPGLLQPETLRGGAIEFRDVSVHGERGPLLNRVSFTVAPGEHLSIVGPSGAGKSTLLKLLARLQEPTSGEIRLGGTTLSGIDAAHLRRRIGYMTQEGYLFHDSLWHNLTYLKPDADAASVERWIGALGADDIVVSLPEGYATPLGDKGAVLSGGQRQLVSLARTMLKQPDLLLLDEVTSALDEASEARVYAALDAHARSERITRISVTHRLRAAAHADRILVLDGGTVVQHGTHEQLLLDSSGLYARLWHSEQLESRMMSGTASENLEEEARDARTRLITRASAGVTATL